MAPPDLETGQIFADDYRVVRLLDRGGMGAVYVAEQLSTGKARALKVIQPHVLGKDPNARLRFTQEARVASRIASEHVVQVVGGGVVGDTPWLAMELLEGETLSAWVERAVLLPIEDVRQVVEQLVHGLAAAHASGIVHRDLKPANVFIAIPRRVNAKFMVKLLDFGISKVIVKPGTVMTTPMGTPGWMAPEQMHKGLPVGPYTDVWALGLLVFWLLTGHSYWVSEDSNLSLLSILQEMRQGATACARERAIEYQCPRFIPLAFDAWFARSVALDGAARFPHAGAAYAELRPILDQVVDHGARSTRTTPPSLQGTAGTQPAPPFTVQVGPIDTARATTPSPVRPRAGDARKALLVGAATVGAVGLAVLSVFLLTGSTMWAERTCRGSTGGATAAVEKACAKACAAKRPGACVAHGEALLSLHSDGALQRARDSFEKACFAGDATGCRRLGHLTESDPKQAATLYEQACNGGDTAACADRGALLEGTAPADEEGAAALYDKACAAGAALGCAYRGFMFMTGRGGTRDAPRGAQGLRGALPALDRACGQGDAPACVARVAAGELLGAGDRAGDAGALDRAACDRGLQLGCVDLATAKVLGLNGVPRAVEDGVASLHEACAARTSAAACANAGALESGADLTAGYGPRGALELRVACTHGVHVGCSGWGPLLERPATLAVHEAEGAQTTDRACDSGVMSACVNLGAFQCAGHGVTRDCAAARASFKRACDSGYAAGCGQLGAAYSLGMGGDVDAPEGDALLVRACDAGELDACIARSALHGSPAALRPMCETEHVATACARYGELLASGAGTTRDLTTGLTFMSRAARGDGLDRSLPVMYAVMGSFETDKGKAAALSGQACDLQIWAGCAARAWSLWNAGNGGRDSETARQLLTRGCDAHDALSCYDLATISLRGQGPLGKPAAVEQLSALCTEDGVKDACADAAKVYRTGFAGRTADSGRAATLAAKACALGRGDACAKTPPTLSPPPRPSLSLALASQCRRLANCMEPYNHKDELTTAQMNECNQICASAK
jgi:TPR repeat protein